MGQGVSFEGGISFGLTPGREFTASSAWTEPGSRHQTSRPVTLVMKGECAHVVKDTDPSSPDTGTWSTWRSAADEEGAGCSPFGFPRSSRIRRSGLSVHGPCREQSTQASNNSDLLTKRTTSKHCKLRVSGELSTRLSGSEAGLQLQLHNEGHLSELPLGAYARALWAVLQTPVRPRPPAPWARRSGRRAEHH